MTRRKGKRYGWKTKHRQREYQRKWKRQRRLDWIAANGPCAWCKSWGMGPLFNFRGLQIDHKKPEHKKLAIAKIWSFTKARRDAELAKCQVLCDDCHDKKTEDDRIRMNGKKVPF